MSHYSDEHCDLYNTPNGYLLVDGRNRLSMIPKSTSVEYWTYEPLTEVLTIQYKSSKTYYDYAGVSLRSVLALAHAESVGHYVATRIKPAHECVA